MKTRISVSIAFRITDCSDELITAIDKMCEEQHTNRVQLIRNMSGNPLRHRGDVFILRKEVKNMGFKNIEDWLYFMILNRRK